jgi:hypothetical protein
MGTSSAGAYGPHEKRIARKARGANRTLQAEAHLAVLHAKRAGVLPQHPQFCCACGRAGEWMPRDIWSIVYHHHDYTQPLNVSAVCQVCHRRIHFGQIPEPATGETRAPDRQQRAGDPWRSPSRLVMHIGEFGIPKESSQPERWAWAARFVDEHGAPPDERQARAAWFASAYPLIPRSWAEVSP